MSIQDVQKAGVLVGFRRKDSRISMKAQTTTLVRFGVPEGKIYDDWGLCIRQRRKGYADTIAVASFFLIADPKRLRAPGGLRDSLIARRAEARKAGATIVDVGANLSTADLDEADEMLRLAMHILAGTQQRSERIGRPPKEYTGDQMTIMKIHWRSNASRTNREALNAMAADGVKVSNQIVTRLLGPSGRRPGPDLGTIKRKQPLKR